MKTGTLKELNVKPGDVVVWTNQRNLGPLKVLSATQIAEGDFMGGIDARFAGWGRGIFINEKFTLISRADDTPTLWRDMTPEEKGKLLLAYHEGREIEILSILDKSHGWIQALGAMESNVWLPNRAYRIKPQPKVETVTIYTGNLHGEWGPWNDEDDTHSITFTVTDGKVDPVAQVEEL